MRATIRTASISTLSLLPAFLLPAFLLLAGPGALLAAGPALPTTPFSNGGGPEPLPPGELAALIHTLENEESRNLLLSRLRTLAQAQGEEPPAPEEAAPSVAETAQAIKELSQEVGSFFESSLALTDNLNHVASAFAWARGELMNPASRRPLLVGSVNVLFVLTTAYLALFAIRFALRRPLRKLLGADRPPPIECFSRLLVGLVIELLPLLVSAGAAGMMLTFLTLAEPTRLVGLAWVYALILTRAVDVLGRAVLATHADHLRLPPLSDESAHYLRIWLQRFAGTGLYGYFAIETGRLLGLGPGIHQGLLRVLGLLLTLMAAVFVLQNREPVGDMIRGEPGSRWLAMRQTLAALWHVPVLAYLFFFYGVWAVRMEHGAETLTTGTVTMAFSLLGGVLLRRLLGNFFAKISALPPDLDARFPGLKLRVNRYLPLLEGLLRVAIHIGVLLAILVGWGLPVENWLLAGPGRTLLTILGKVALVFFSALMVWELTSIIMESFLAEHDRYGRVKVRSARIRTLLTVARTALLVALTVITTLVLLSELGVNIAPLLATAGVLGLAVGFGSQKLVQEVITGFFILLEGTFSVGDVIKVGDRAGLVEAVSIRTVRLRDLTGTVHTIPFSAIDSVSNLTKEFSFHVFDIAAAYREDVDQVMTVIREVGETLRADPTVGPLILEPIEVFGVDALADSGVVIKGRIKTLPIRQWEVGRAFNRGVKRRFDELGIRIPAPRRTLYFGEDPQGGPGSVRVRMEPAREGDAAAEGAVPEGAPLTEGLMDGWPHQPAQSPIKP